MANAVNDTALVAIQALIVTLNADTAVNNALAGRIYTDVPQGATFPYLQLSIASDPFAAADFSGQAHLVRFQVRSQEDSAAECLTIRKAVLAAVDRQEQNISLSSGTLVKAEYAGGSDAFKEDDGRTWQAVAEIEMIIV